MYSTIDALARKLADIDPDVSDDSVTAAWSELLQQAENTSPALYDELVGQYDALHQLGPDPSGGQAERIARLLALLSTGALSAVGDWLEGDEAAGDGNDWTIDEFPDFGDSEAMQFSTSADDGSGHWITIGAVEGADGKRHGGTPVKIVGGKIVSGPKRLRGRSIKGLANPRANPHKEYRRAVKHAAKEHGVRESDLHDAIEFVHGERSLHHGEREAAKEAARKLTGLAAGDIGRVANAGHDYSSAHKLGGATGEKFRHFDEFAQETARAHPELGLGDPDDPRANFAEGLWNALAEGKRPMLAKHDPKVIDEAVRLLHASGGKHYQRVDEADAVPFSTRS